MSHHVPQSHKQTKIAQEFGLKSIIGLLFKYTVPQLKITLKQKMMQKCKEYGSE